MKYLITFKDPDFAVQGAGGGLTSLPVKAAPWFEFDEYLTIEWDSQTLQMRVCHPSESLAVVIPSGETVASELRVARLHVMGDSRKFYDVALYTDRAHTCTCPSWFFGNTRHGLGWCKHILTAMESHRDSEQAAIVWEDTTHDDRDQFRKDQALIYDTR